MQGNKSIRNKIKLNEMGVLTDNSNNNIKWEEKEKNWRRINKK